MRMGTTLQGLGDPLGGGGAPLTGYWIERAA